MIPLLLAFAVGTLSVDGTFVHDDRLAITLNPVVNGEVSRNEAFVRDFWGHPLDERPSSYRPLMTWGWSWLFTPHASPVPYRLLTLLLFVICTEMVRRLFAIHLGHEGERATLAASLFAISPIHAEVLGSIVGQADLLSAALGTGALVVGARSRNRAFLASFLLALGCLVKETTVFFGFALVLFEFVATSDNRKRAFLLAPVLVLVLAVAGHMSIDRDVALMDPRNNLGADADGWMRVLWGLFETGRATWLSLVPWPLAPNHGYAAAVLEPRHLGPEAALGLVALLLGAAATVFAVKNRNARVLAGLALFFGPILLQSNLVIRTQTDLAERLLFVSSIPVAAVLGVVLTQRRFAHPLRVAIATGIVVFYAVDTWVSVRAWRTDLSLWGRAVQTTPQSLRSQLNYSVALLYVGRENEGAWHQLLAHYIVASYPDPIDWSRIESMESIPIESRLIDAPERLVGKEGACDLVSKTYNGLSHYQAAIAERLHPVWQRRYCRS